LPEFLTGRDGVILASGRRCWPAVQDRPADRGADRPVHRPPRVPADPDAQPGRRHHRRHRQRPGAHRRPDGRAGIRGGPAGCDPRRRPHRGAGHPGRDRQRHDPLPDPGAPDLLGPLRPPGVSESAGRKKGNAGTGYGNRDLARVLGEAAIGAARIDTFLGERYRRLARRRRKRKNRAIVAIGRSILVIIWALLSDPDAQFTDLGSDYYASRNNPERKARHHIRELQALGYSVTLNPAA
jgi:hypothetical protein